MKSLITLAVAGTLLAGCGAMRSVSSDVASYGDWPSERKPGTYAFDRLPSQQAQADEADKLELAARPALEKAGFVPAAAGAAPDVLVQVGARVSRADPQPWNDPLWWRGGFGGWRYGPWGGPGWGAYGRFPGYGGYYDAPRYDREVAVLLRDRSSGKPLFEARASNESVSTPSAKVLSAMFDAALMDFPRLGVNPRRVVVALPDVATAQ